MKTKKVQEKDIKFENPNQIINMGGPWVGNLFLNGVFITSNVNIDNVVCKPSGSQVFFVKYYDISKWQNKNFFTINFLDLISNLLYEFERKFDKVFLGEFKNDNELEIYSAFHLDNSTLKTMFNTKIEHNIEKEKGY